MKPHAWVFQKKEPTGTSVWSCRGCDISIWSDDAPAVEDDVIRIVINGRPGVFCVPVDCDMLIVEEVVGS